MIYPPKWERILEDDAPDDAPPDEPGYDQTEYNQIQSAIVLALTDLIKRGFNQALISNVLTDLIMHPEKAFDWRKPE